MASVMNYIALIPAYEPDEKLLSLIDELTRSGFETVVVDDGSGPDYRDIFRRAERRATVISYENNMGKGAALKTGLAYIYDCKCDTAGSTTIVVTVDADGQHRAEDVIRVAAAAADQTGTLVLVSCGFSSAEIPFRSRFGNSLTKHVFRLSTGVPVSDTQTGLRAFSADLIPRMLAVRGRRYEYEINMLLEFAADNIPIREERIETVYIDNNSSSHFNAVKDSFRIYREILKFSASSLIGFVMDYAVFALLTLLTPSLAAANIGARLVSSVTNYTLNRKFVFGSSKKVSASAPQYFALAAVILAGNTIVLDLIAGRFGISSYAAKIITELIFFVMSWTVQRYIIFYNEEERENPEPHKGEREAASGRAYNTGNVRFTVKRRAVRTPKLRAVVSAETAGVSERRPE